MEEPAKAAASDSRSNHLTASGEASGEQGSGELMIGASTDRVEHEADSFAARVMEHAVREGAPSDAADATGVRPSTGFPAPPGFAEAFHRLSRFGGRPLIGELRTTMESKFGANFSAVRVHDDHGSAALAERIGSRAFTVGRHVFFNRGEFRPSSLPGRRLLAHELSHVVQHGRAGENDRFIVRRAIKIDKVAAELTTKVTTNGEPDTESAPWVDEIMYGISTFLGIGVKRRTSGNEIVLEYDGRIEGFDVRVDKLLAERFATPVMMLKAGELEDRENLKEEYGKKGIDEARMDFEYVREVVEYYLKIKDIALRADPEWRTAVEYSTDEGDVRVNPKLYQQIAIDTRSMWDGFWVFVHELLHKGSPRFPSLRDDMRQSKSIGDDAPQPYTTRKEVDLRPASGEKPLEKPEKRPWSQIGQPEERLNVVRYVFGLPLRSGYSDAQGPLTVIRFADDTAPVPGGRRSTKLSHGAKYEYTGVIMYGRTGDGSKAPSRSSVEAKYWREILVSLPSHRGFVTDERGKEKEASFRFASGGNEGDLTLTISYGKRTIRAVASVEPDAFDVRIELAQPGGAIGTLRLRASGIGEYATAKRQLDATKVDPRAIKDAPAIRGTVRVDGARLDLQVNLREPAPGG